MTIKTITNSIITLAVACQFGCSESPTESPTGAATGAATEGSNPPGFESPEQLFEEIKRLGVDDPSLYPKDDKAFIAYMNVLIARMKMAFAEDDTQRGEAEEALTAIIEKYDLSGKLEISDDPNPAALRSLAETAFADVDVDAFLRDMPMEGDEDDAPVVGMEDLAVQSDEAEAVLIDSEGYEKRVVFVRSDGRWFFSLVEGEERAAMETTPRILQLTFSDQASMSKATARGLLEGVSYDPYSPVRLKKTDEPLQLELEFYEVDSDDGESSYDIISKAPGVMDIQ